MIDRTREIALKILYKIDKEGAFSNIALNEEISKNRNVLTDKDIGFISEIVYGTTTWKLTLDEIIKNYSNIKLKKISPWILNILRMGIYQIIFLDKIPKSAAVNESVNLAKRYGHKSSSNFVNAILRKVEKTDYDKFEEIEDEIERISKTTSMPQWIIEELLKEIPTKNVYEICKYSNLRPKVSIRINRLNNSKENVKKELEKINIKTEDGILDDFLILDKAKNIDNMEEYKKGEFTVQDEAAGLIPKILEPKENEIILDACSSPGGKTTYIAELMNNCGKIEAWDIYEHRVNLVKNAANRLKINIINTRVKDATVYDENYKEYFDKILLDVPCLGIGVLKRKPDIKWQRNKEDINNISKIQFKILETCSKYLKKGGYLVYSTCSILKEENQNVVEKFIKENNEFEIVEIKNIKSDFFNKYMKDNKYIQVCQNEYTDGFFICKIKRKN